MDWLFAQKKKGKDKDKARFVILPDTQTYVEKHPKVLDGYFGWIVENRRNIDAVIQVGDITQENYPAEWWIMKNQFARLDKAGIPYTIAWGNHDIGSKPMKCSDVYNTDIANHYFPLIEKKQKSYWGDTADGKTLDNHYITLKAGGVDWLIMSLAFGPSDESLDWANQMVASNPDKVVIVNTHAYLYSDSTLLDEGDSWRPQNYGIGKEEGRTVNDGKGIWEKFVSQHPNIIAVFCGHVLHTGVGTLVSEGKHGNKVYQMLANYQRGVKDSQNGGEGYLRIITFDKKKKEIDVKTYSTWNKAYHPSPEHNFVFSLSPCNPH
ncbi:phosphoesterase [Bacteroides sp. 51]|nr:phosphoesterase [Bacteroides sp. 51]